MILCFSNFLGCVEQLDFRYMCLEPYPEHNLKFVKNNGTKLYLFRISKLLLFLNGRRSYTKAVFVKKL